MTVKTKFTPTMAPTPTTEAEWGQQRYLRRATHHAPRAAVSSLRAFSDKIAHQAGYELKEHRWHATGANPQMAAVRDSYVRASGVQAAPLTEIKKIDTDFATRVGQAYDDLPMYDPAALPAYEALGREIEAQYKHLTDHGYRFNFHYEHYEPYKTSDEMRADLHGNKKMEVLATAAAFGGEPFQHHYQVQNGVNVPVVDQPNPLLKHVVGLSTPEKPVTLNCLLRACHDTYAHGVMPHQFGPLGEDNAYREHAAMLSPLARKALATETRGQNSWVNFHNVKRPDGSIPKKGDKDFIAPADRDFAPQKIALLPEWAHELYASPVGRSYSAAPDQSSRARLTALLGILKSMAGR